MRKLNLALMVFLLASAAANAQWSKGRIIVGGTLSFFHQDFASKQSGRADSFSSRYLSTGLHGRKFLRQNLAAGIMLGYSYGSYKTNNQNAIGRNFAYSGGFFVSRFVPIAGRFSCEATSSLGWTRQKLTDWQDDQKTFERRINVVGISVVPCLNFRATRRLYFQIGLAQLLHFDVNMTRNNDYVNNEETRGSDFRAGIGAGGSIPLTFGTFFLF